MTKKTNIIMLILMSIVSLVLISAIIFVSIKSMPERKTFAINYSFEGVDAKVVTLGESFEGEYTSNSAEYSAHSEKVENYIIEDMDILCYQIHNMSNDSKILVELVNIPTTANVDLKYFVSDSLVQEFSDVEKQDEFSNVLLEANSSKYIYTFVRTLNAKIDSLCVGNMSWRFTTPEEYLVNYNTFGSNEFRNLSSDIAVQGIGYVPKVAPEKDGYVFSGWYLDSNCTILFNDGDLITGNATLYAKYIKSTIDVSSYTFNKSNNTAVVTGSISPVNEVVAIPGTVTYGGETYFVTGVMSNITDVEVRELYIGNNVKYLSNNFAAFNSDLQKVYIGASLTSISEGAFENCINLQDVVFATNSNLQTIEKMAFYYSGITSIDLPETLTEIGDYAFYSANLHTINLPRNVNYVGEFAFASMPYLENVHINAKLDTISNYAFAYNNKLSNLEIMGTVTSIGQYAFAESRAASTIYLNEGVEVVDDFAFYNKNVQYIYFPSSVRYIGKGVVTEKYSYINIALSQDNSIYDNRERFNGIIETAIDKVIVASANSELPYTIKTIGDSAYLDNSFLQTIVMSEKVEKVEANAFKNCKKLSELKIPYSVMYIGEYAFEGCDVLESVIFEDVTVWTNNDEIINVKGMNSNAEKLVSIWSSYPLINQG